MATGRRILLHPYPGRHFPNKNVILLHSNAYNKKTTVLLQKILSCIRPEAFRPIVFYPPILSPIKQYGIQRIQRLRLIRGCLCNNVIHFRHPNQRDQLSPYLSRRHVFILMETPVVPGSAFQPNRSVTPIQQIPSK